jgi:hypothetical protein
MTILNATEQEIVDSNDLYEEVLTQAAAQARRYLRAIRERHAGVLPEAIKGLSALGGPLPAHGENPLARISHNQEADLGEGI